MYTRVSLIVRDAWFAGTIGWRTYWRRWRPWGRGFGFVLPDGLRTTAFIHVKNVEGQLLLKPNDRVEFDLIDTKKGPLAINAVLLSDGGAL